MTGGGLLREKDIESDVGGGSSRGFGCVMAVGFGGSGAVM